MAIQISTNDIDTDGFFITTFTGDDTGQRLKGRIRCPRQFLQYSGISCFLALPVHPVRCPSGRLTVHLR